jgi:tetratricopeptide (TPR) repeat protein
MLKKAKDPVDTRGFFVRGYTLKVLQQHEKALEAFSKALELDPNNAAAYCLRAFTYDALYKWGLAAADRAKYKELTGEDPE